MMKYYFTILTYWLFLFNATGQTTYAVAVGVSDYQEFGLESNDLEFAAKDASLFVNFLQSKQGGNVPANNIMLLTNTNATKAKIQQALAIFKKAGVNDKIYFFFSGHGSPGIFAPHDINPYGGNALSHNNVKAAFKASKAGTKIIVADACFSGSMKKEANKSISKEDVTLESFLGLENAFKEFKSISNVAVILSSRSYQLSQENSFLKEGVLTYYLLKGLNGAADSNNDRKVSIEEAFRYISPRIKKETRGAQAPIIYGKFNKSLVLSTF